MILPPGLIALMGFTIFFIAILGVVVALTLYYGYCKGNRFTMTKKLAEEKVLEKKVIQDQTFISGSPQ